MAWKDLFKTPEDKKREEKRRTIEARRKADRLADKFKEKVDELKRDRDRAWQEAVVERKAGNKTSAQRSLRTVQSLEQTIGQLEVRRFTFEQIGRRFEMADLDREMQISIGDLGNTVKLDVAELEDALLGATDKLSDFNDANKIFDKIANKQMDGIAASADALPMSDLEKRLDMEVADSIGNDSATSKISPEALDEISKGRDELKKLLDKEK